MSISIQFNITRLNLKCAVDVFDLDQTDHLERVSAHIHRDLGPVAAVFVDGQLELLGVSRRCGHCASVPTSFIRSVIARFKGNFRAEVLRPVFRIICSAGLLERLSKPAHRHGDRVIQHRRCIHRQRHGCIRAVGIDLGSCARGEGQLKAELGCCRGIIGGGHIQRSRFTHPANRSMHNICTTKCIVLLREPNYSLAIAIELCTICCSTILDRYHRICNSIVIRIHRSDDSAIQLCAVLRLRAGAVSSIVGLRQELHVLLVCAADFQRTNAAILRGCDCRLCSGFAAIAAIAAVGKSDVNVSNSVVMIASVISFPSSFSESRFFSIALRSFSTSLASADDFIGQGNNAASNVHVSAAAAITRRTVPAVCTLSACSALAAIAGIVHVPFIIINIISIVFINGFAANTAYTVLAAIAAANICCICTASDCHTTAGDGNGTTVATMTGTASIQSNVIIAGTHMT